MIIERGSFVRSGLRGAGFLADEIGNAGRVSRDDVARTRPAEREVELLSDAEILASVKRGLPPPDCPVLGTWRLLSYVRERLSDGHRHNQFGENPDGYIGYAPDGRMYAIFVRHDRMAPRDVVPTDEEGVQLLGTMVAYAGTFSLGTNVVVHHIDTSWNQAWTGTDQIRHFILEGDMLEITTAPYKSYLDGTLGRSILAWRRVRA